MSTVTASSHRPYVSRRKRHRSSSSLFSGKLSSKATLGLLGLLLVALVVSLGVIAFTLSRGEEAVATDTTLPPTQVVAAPEPAPAPAK